MVEGVDHGGMELKRRSFGELELLKDTEVGNVGDGILGHVASGVAKGCAKERLRLARVQNVSHIILGNRNKRTVYVSVFTVLFHCRAWNLKKRTSQSIQAD